MPEIARFFGIIIRMYAEAGGPHHRPHFHAYYQQEIAIYGIDSVELIAGSLPRQQQRFVEAWAELHQQDLLENWKLLQEGRVPAKIEPLR
jgi:Domain of unknown function (DUF4160)